MTATQLETTTIDATEARAIAVRWLAEFGRAADAKDVAGIVALLASNTWWRDLFALTWDLTAMRGADDITGVLSGVFEDNDFGDVEIDDSVPAAWENNTYIEAIYTFNTRHATGRGVIRLVQEEGDWKAMIISTSLEGLRERPVRRVSVDDAADDANNLPVEPGQRFSAAELRSKRLEYADHGPDVLIIGAGHSGLFLSAQLQQLGVDALMVDQNSRAGDNWRNRYNGLILHDTKWAVQFPYMPFPETWPLFTPKDMLADWMEAYVKFLDLDLWTSTTVIRADYDNEAKTWTVELDRDGQRRTLVTHHLVFASGKDATPQTPAIPGIDTFEGTITHSAGHVGGKDLNGHRVLVVGSGASAHDIAQDAYEHGATTVTMLQRSPVHVLSQRYGIKTLHGKYYGENSPPVRDADLIASANPLAFSTLMSPTVTRKIAEADAELLSGLEKANYRTWLGPNDAGQAYLATIGGGSIYIDKGACQLIIDRKIRIQPGEIETFTPSGVVYKDGTEEEVDLVIFCTGFSNMREAARPIVGDEIADQLGGFWGVDERGELRTTGRHSGHEKLWLTSNGFRLARLFTKHLALVIQAMEVGVLDPAISTKLRTD